MGACAPLFESEQGGVTLNGFRGCLPKVFSAGAQGLSLLLTGPFIERGLANRRVDFPRAARTCPGLHAFARCAGSPTEV